LGGAERYGRQDCANQNGDENRYELRQVQTLELR